MVCHLSFNYYSASRYVGLENKTHQSARLFPMSVLFRRPPPIDNSSLLDDKMVLRRGCIGKSLSPKSCKQYSSVSHNLAQTEDIDFVVLSKAEWKLLSRWYGLLGPALPRKVCSCRCVLLC